MKCTFCKRDIPEGRAKIFATRTGKTSYFCSSKCQRNDKIRKPFKLKWVTKEKKKKSEVKTGAKQMKIVMLGPPGSGKGTYSIRLSGILGIPHISTGEIFRENMKNGTELGKIAEEAYKAGHLVSDDVTNAMVKERLKNKDCANGFIFDGYPRTLNQTKELEKISNVTVALYLDIPEDILIEKAMARVQCRNCGDIYNLANINRSGVRMPPMLPKVEGKCDKCGGELYKRDIDTEEKIRERFRSGFITPPEVLKFYEKQGNLKKVKVDSPPEEMIPKILKILEEYRN